ncbi:hypothetical protein R3W88_009285 [Solanum pinnatisectum]|uniref:Uncharacterized protein n=1 Tax=Solanum pinnatisectum TaxID=50273 RepID=A0AAV9MAY8_9SOLN|nr:hypothetical protein R3W88_009285 [Solanum pinnatisectum]
MKSVVLLISVVVAFWCSCTSATTTPNQVLQVVCDTDGNILRSDNRYFVVSAIRGARGGGVFRDSTVEGSSRCPEQYMYGGCSTITTFPMLLSTTGEVGNTKNEASWFQIKKVLNAAGDYSYKLVFCPPSKHVCLDIGIEFVDAQPQLAIGTPLKLHFIKDTYIGIKSII